MPRRPRVKTRTDYLAEALEAAQAADKIFADLDLRTCPKPVREGIKQLRVTATDLVRQTAEVMQIDHLASSPLATPANPPKPRSNAS